MSSVQKMLAVADWALLQAEMFMTPQILPFPTATNAIKQAFFAIPVWGLATTCIKISVALTMLRIPVNRLWTVFLYSVTGLQVAYFIGNTVFTFVACKPVQSNWDLSITDAHCLASQKSTRIVSNIGSAVNILTDVLLSLAPMVVLWNLRRPLRERILVCCLTGIGLLASIACIVKAVIIQRWGDLDVDIWALGISIATWTILEQFLAVIAACSPSLKQPLQRILGRFGIFLTHYSSQVSFVRVRRSAVGTETAGHRQGTEQDVGLPRPVYFRPNSDADEMTDVNSSTKSIRCEKNSNIMV